MHLFQRLFQNKLFMTEFQCIFKKVSLAFLGITFFFNAVDSHTCIVTQPFGALPTQRRYVLNANLQRMDLNDPYNEESIP